MTCRKCLYWKRRGLLSGTCWHNPEANHGLGADTKATDTCESYAPKLKAGHGPDSLNEKPV